MLKFEPLEQLIVSFVPSQDKSNANSKLCLLLVNYEQILIHQETEE